MAHIRLVTRGDNAGMCHTANLAIRDACERGILRNVSVMAPAPALAEAAEMLAKIPGLAIGLHIDLTAEWEHLCWGPVLPRDQVPSLVDQDGHFIKTTRAFAEHNPALADMQAEVCAQLDALRQAGFSVSYVDEHMGVGWIAGLRQWLYGWCEEGLVYNQRLLAEGRMRYLRLPEDSDLEPAARVITTLQAAESGTYLLVGHPAYLTADMEQAVLPGGSPGVEARLRDGQRQWFMAPEVLDYCRAANVEPIRYTDVMGLEM